MYVNEITKFNNIAKLLTYLRMDENNTVTYNNGITDLRVRMTKDYILMCTNLSFPDLPETNFLEQWTVPYMLDVIDVLKETPVTGELASYFKSEWDRINTEVGTMKALNFSAIKKYSNDD